MSFAASRAASILALRFREALSAANLSNPPSPANQLIESAPAIAAQQQASGFPSQSYEQVAEMLTAPIPDIIETGR